MQAVVAQLAERGLPKPEVAGSTPVYRSICNALEIISYFDFQRLFFILYQLDFRPFSRVARLIWPRSLPIRLRGRNLR